MRVVAAVMLVTGLAITGCADDPEVIAARAAAARDAAAAARPWEGARAELDATLVDIKAGGLRAVDPHVAALERALADADRALALAGAGRNGVVLTDGAVESLAALLSAAATGAAADGKVTAIANPYPVISLVLGSYYVESNRPDDAVRVLDAGLALPSSVADGKLGASVPALTSERATALGLLKRWPQALAAWERGLALPGLTDRARARMLRGRGIALIELRRLNEAELSFRSSLVAEPENPLALNELGYIAALQAGRPAAAVRASQR